MSYQRLSAGQLNQRIQIQSQDGTENGLGERVGSWVNEGDPIWAAARPLRGTKRAEAGALHLAVDTVFFVRWKPGISAANRLLWEGRAYDIVSAEPIDGGKVWIEIQAVTGVRDGR